MKKKKRGVSIVIGILVFLLLCTFLSKTISSAFLREVSTARVFRGILTVSAKTEGAVELGGEKSVPSPFDFEVLEVLVSEGQQLQKGQCVMTVDMQAMERKEAELALAVAQLQPDPDTWYSGRQLQELAQQRKLAQDELDTFRAHMPEDGKLLAEESGQVLSVAVGKYQKVEKGEELYSCYTTEGVQPAVSFTLPEAKAEEYQKGSPVTLGYNKVVKVNGEEITELVTEELPVSEKQYLEDGSCRFRVNLKDGEGVFDRQKVKISLVSSSKNYDKILPITAISEGEDRKDIVYILKSRDGLFGKETYLQSVEVEELIRNSEYAAVSCDELFEETEVVASAEGSLQDGKLVKVKE